jgi:hypothetical protein
MVGRPFVSKMHAGERWVAVGHKIFRVAEDATVHDFLEGFLGRVLSPEWIAREQERPWSSGTPSRAGTRTSSRCGRIRPRRRTTV